MSAISKVLKKSGRLESAIHYMTTHSKGRAPTNRVIKGLCNKYGLSIGQAAALYREWSTGLLEQNETTTREIK